MIRDYPVGNILSLLCWGSTRALGDLGRLQFTFRDLGGPLGFGRIREKGYLFQGFGEKGHLSSGIWGRKHNFFFFFLGGGVREQGAEETF